ncbi:MAG: efflux RND transporter periplasmic adaptor subunit [Planctomycetaceae bacterium]|nr:efflux RND transporter periplasmic adaptor subunit [Planctomycetaceae bacterium]
MGTAQAPVDAATSKPIAPKSGRWSTFKFVFQALEVRLRFIGILVAIGLLFGYWDTLRNYWDKWTRPANAAVALSSGTEFYCPMDPQVVRDSLEPDGSIPNCPICGMPLSKRKKGEQPALPAGVVGRVQLSPERVEMAGVATASVGYQPLVREVRTVGYVTYDESKLSEVTTRVGGYVEKLFVNETFATVSNGDKLAEVYSPELYQAAQELVLLRGGKQFDALINGAHEKLRLLGIGESEIDHIWKTGKTDSRLVIRSPQTGHVIKKNVVEGARIEPGQVLFELADLTTVWIEADVYEKDLAALHEGQNISATVDAYPSRVFEGTVALIHPHLERSTRTNRVRFEVKNTDHQLRPGMYASVRLATPVAETEPFRTEIAKRQTAPVGGDKAALIAWQRNCPVTGLPLGSMGEPVSVTAKGQELFLCCSGCVDDIQKTPDRYLAKLTPPPRDEVLTVPQTAVIDTGERQVVYIERTPGVFEGVVVTLGPRVGDQFPVLAGLQPGDKVATAGSFLIDAETRLNPAAASAYFGATGGPASSAGGSVQRADEGGASVKPPAKDATNKVAATTLNADQLAEIAKLPPADQKVAKVQKLCPVTELPLGSMGVPLKKTVAGETVFLCCASCEAKLKAEPQKYLDKIYRWQD